MIAVPCFSSDDDHLYELSLREIIRKDNCPGPEYQNLGYKTTHDLMAKMRSLNKGYLPVSPRTEQKIAMDLYYRCFSDQDKANRLLSNFSEDNKLYPRSVKGIRDDLNSRYASSEDEDDGKI